MDEPDSGRTSFFGRLIADEIAAWREQYRFLREHLNFTDVVNVICLGGAICAPVTVIYLFETWTVGGVAGLFAFMSIGLLAYRMGRESGWQARFDEEYESRLPEPEREQRANARLAARRDTRNVIFGALTFFALMFFVALLIP